MGLFLGDSEPSKIFVGDTPISKVFLGDTQVRPSGGGGWQPGPNTIAYYEFNNNLLDSSGNGNDATMQGNLTYTLFSGSTDDYYANGDNAGAETPITQAQFYNNSFTLSAWMKMNSSSTLQRLFRYAHTSSLDIQYEFYNAFSGLQVYMDYKHSNQRISFPMANPGVGVWKHLLFTGDGVTQIKAYIDGVEVQPYSNYNPTFTYDAPAVPFTILQYSGTPQQNMSVDNVIMENIVWTAQEVSDYYNQTKSKYGY